MNDGVPPVDFGRLGPAPGTRLAVVGGCGGIGRVLVEAGCALGLELAVLDLPASYERHGVPKGVHFLPFDATDEAQVGRAFDALATRWNAIGAYVHLAGFASARVPAADTAPDDFDRVIAGNLRSVYLCARAVLPLLAARGGALVHTASGLAFRTLPGFSPYSASKAGVVAFTKALAAENAPLVRANVVAPTAVDTAFLRGGTGRGGDDSTDSHIDVEAYEKTVPLGRIAVPEDVVGPILFLLGDAARYMTGQVLHVSGGAIAP